MSNLPDLQPFNLIKSLLSHRLHIENQLSTSETDTDKTLPVDKFIASIEHGMTTICHEEIQRTTFVINKIYHGSYRYCSTCGQGLLNKTLDNNPLRTICSSCAQNDNQNS